MLVFKQCFARILDPCVVIVQQQQPSEQHNEKQHVVNTNKTLNDKTAALVKHVTQKMPRAGDTVTTKVKLFIHCVYIVQRLEFIIYCLI